MSVRGSTRRRSKQRMENQGKHGDTTKHQQLCVFQPYNLRHALVKSQIKGCIDSEMKMKIMDKTSADEMWMTLKAFHNGSSANDKDRRRAELHGMRFSDFRDMSSFLYAVLQKKRELINVSATGGDDDSWSWMHSQNHFATPPLIYEARTSPSMRPSST